MADDKKRAVLGMPGYGHQTAGAARGFYIATRNMVDVDLLRVPMETQREYQEGSLPCQNFNALWCIAMTLCHKGKRVDYFAMLHTDIEPDNFWLDQLIQEMERRELDVLGAVAPIKDHRGITSIALQRPDGDTWRPLCRLSMKEIYDLPETFTSEEVGHDLLINTGCWVCRFDMAWATKITFTVNDRNYFDPQHDMWRAQAEPEDWNFSRQCHALGLKIGATRKIKLEHAGKTKFSNRMVWGSQWFDWEYVPESIIPIQEKEGFRFPHDVEGWLLPEEGKALADLARGKRVLEIGSYCGRSTICMAQTATHVTSIDPHDGRATPRPRNTFAEFCANLDRYGVASKVSSREPGYIPDTPKYDLVFIDGDHAYESVRRDIQQSVDLLAPGGLLAFHDYRTSPGEFDGHWDAGVTQAVDELLTAGGELVTRHATVAVVRPPAQVLSEV
jgi:predicted O-methyltransferase YrrM